MGWYEGMAGLVAGGVALALYWSTVGGITAGDAGELLAAAKAWGVAHPPGYPLWTMLVGLLLHQQGALVVALQRCADMPSLPTPVIQICAARASAWQRSDPARLAGFFSGLCGAVAVGLVAAAAVRLGKGPPRFAVAGGRAKLSECRNPRAVRAVCAACAAVTLGACESVWRYALQAEIFALNSLLVAFIFYTSVRYAERPGAGAARWVAFACGLGMTNQHTLALYVLPIALWVMWVGRARLLTGRALAGLSASALVGLLPYAYLPVASYHSRGCSWGDPMSVSGFLRHFLRSEYGTFRLAHDIQVKGQSTLELVKHFVETVCSDNPLGAAAAVFGVFQHLTVPAVVDRGLRSTLLAALALYIGVFTCLSNVELSASGHRSVYRRFWGQGLMVLYFPFVCDAMETAALFLSLVREFIAAPRQKFRNAAALRKCFSEFAPAAEHAMGLAVVVAVTAVSAGVGWRHARESMAYSRVAYSYAKSLVLGIPKRDDGAPSILISYKGDVHGYLARYVGDVVRLRPDVRVLTFSNRYAKDFDRDAFAARYPGLQLPKDYPLSPEDAGFVGKDPMDELLDNFKNGDMKALEELHAILKRRGGWCFKKFYEANGGPDGAFYVGGIWDASAYDLPHICVTYDEATGKSSSGSPEDTEAQFHSLPGYGHASRLIYADSFSDTPEEITRYVKQTVYHVLASYAPVLEQVRRHPGLWKTYKVEDNPATAPYAVTRMPRLHIDRQEASLPLDMLQLVQSHVATVYGLLQKTVHKIQDEMGPAEDLDNVDSETLHSVVAKSKLIHVLSPAMKSLRDVIVAFSVAGVESENFDFLHKTMDGVLVQFKDILSQAEAMAATEQFDLDSPENKAAINKIVASNS